MMGKAILEGKDPEKIPVKGDMGGKPCSPGAGMKQLPRVPLISWVQAGEWSEAVDEFHSWYAEEWVYSAKNVSPNAFALRIVGDLMEPEFREGEAIIVDPGLEAVSGKYVIAKNGDQEVTFKQLFIDGSDVYLSPLNDRYPVKNITGQNIRIIGVVTQKVKEY
ncbi:MAG: LexA family protein [Thermodesulfobacteriota bacterium]